MGRNKNNAPPEAALIPEILLPEDTPVSLARIEGAELPQLYRLARQALAQLEVSGIPETKLLGDRLDVIASLAKQARDRTLLNQVLRYRAYCERQLGAQIGELKASGGLNRGVELDGRDSFGGYRALPPKTTEAATLEELGVSKRQSSRAQAIASMPQEEFEAAVEADSPPSLSALAEMARPAARPAPVVPAQEPDPFMVELEALLKVESNIRAMVETAKASEAPRWGLALSGAIARLQIDRRILAEAEGGGIVLHMRDRGDRRRA